MPHTTPVHIRIVEGLTLVHVKELFDAIILLDFDDAAGYGFIDTSIENTSLTSTLVLRRITYHTSFDRITQEFSKHISEYYERVPFMVDSKYGTLEVISNLTNTRRVVSLLSRLMKFNLTIADPDFTPRSFLDRLSESQIPFSLRRLSMNGLMINPGIVGRFTAYVADSQSGVELISSQATSSSEIEKLTFEIALDALETEEMVEVTVSRNGGMTVTCDEDDLQDVLEEIKDLLLGGAYNG